MVLQLKEPLELLVFVKGREFLPGKTHSFLSSFIPFHSSNRTNSKTDTRADSILVHQDSMQNIYNLVTMTKTISNIFLLCLLGVI